MTKLRPHILPFLVLSLFTLMSTSTARSADLLGGSMADAFKLSVDDGEARLREIDSPGDAPFEGGALEVSISEKPAKNWKVRLQGRNARSIQKGETVRVDFHIRSAVPGWGEGQAFFFAQVGGSEFPFRLKTFPGKNWEKQSGSFTAPRDYAAKELLFNLNLGFKTQKVQIGGMSIVSGEEAAPPAGDGAGSVKVLLSEGFNGGFREVRDRKYKGEVGGELPRSLKDNTAWADADVTYSRRADGAHEGAGYLRMEVGAVRKGFVQVLNPGLRVPRGATVTVRLAYRGDDLVAGFRQGSGPYKRLWEETLRGGADWKERELTVPPLGDREDVDFYLGARGAGSIDVDALEIRVEAPSAPKDGDSAGEGPRSLIEPAISDAFKLSVGAGDATLREIDDPAGAPFEGDALEVAVTEVPDKNWKVRLQGRSTKPIRKGEKVVVELYARSVGGDGADGKMFFFAQVGGSEFPFRLKTFLGKNWEKQSGSFTAPRDYAAKELLFNLNLGFKTQKVQIGGMSIVSGEKAAPPAGLGAGSVKVLLSEDFNGGFREVRDRKYKGAVGGELPRSLKDNTAWADADVTYSRRADGAHEGAGYLRMEVGAVRKGFVQVLNPGLRVPRGATVTVRLAHRGGDLVAGFRQGSGPYKRLWEETLRGGADWKERELTVPPLGDREDVDFYLGARGAGTIDVDALEIRVEMPAAPGDGASATDGPRSLIEPAISDAFKLAVEAGDATLREIEDPAGAPFEGDALEVAVTEAPDKNWKVRLQGRCTKPIRKGEKVVVELYARSVGGDGSDGKLFFFAQVGGSEFPFRLKTFPGREWGSAYGTFEAVRDYDRNELLFNLNMGFEEQTLQVGGVKIEAHPARVNTENLLLSKLVGTKIEADFNGGFDPVRERKYKGEVIGVIPAGFKDNTAWADADVTYSRFEDDPYEGEAALRVDVGEIRKGFVHLLKPGTGLTTDASTRIQLATRSAGGTRVVVGFRQGSAPYKRLWEATLESGPEWRKQNLIVPPVADDPDADFYLAFREAGRVEVDDLSIEFMSNEERAADLEGNLAPVSSFPLGLAPPAAPSHHYYHPDQYQVETDMRGPTGMPALRIAPTELFQGKGHFWVRFPVDLPPGPYTLSVYAKGSRSRQGLSLRIGPPSKRHWEPPFSKSIPIGTEWDRYQATFDLPASPDGFYVATIVASHEMWIDGIQLEKGGRATPFERTGRVELAVRPADLTYGVTMKGEPLAARVAVFGEASDGMRLKGRLVDLANESYDLPMIELGGESYQELTVAARDLGELPFGTYNLILRVVDADGKPVSDFAEVLLHRIRPPRRPDEVATDSPFGTQMMPIPSIVETVRTLGFKWVRIWDLYWRDLEPEKGNWRWDEADRIVKLLRDHHFEIMAIAGTFPDHANNAPDHIRQKWVGHNLIPEELGPWGGYVEAIVDRYKDDIHTWEVWNEPYWPKYLPGEITPGGKAVHATPKQFVDLFVAGAKAARRADPDARLAWNTSGGEKTAWDREVMEQGVLEHLDLLTLHKYTNSSVGFPGDAIYREAERLRDNLPEAHRNLPVWNTEGGWHGMIRNVSLVHPPENLRSEVRRNANFQIGYYMSSLGSGVEKYFNFMFSSWGRYRGTWSLFNDDGQLSATATALANMIWHLDGLDFLRVEEVDTEVYAYLFEGDDRAVAVIIGKGTGRLDITRLPEDATLAGPFGNPIALPHVLGVDADFLTVPGGKAADLLTVLMKE